MTVRRSIGARIARQGVRGLGASPAYRITEVISMPEPTAANVPPVDCPCDGCAVLRREVGADPDLFALYRKKLLIRGWAGKTTPAEKQYQQAHASWAQSAARSGARLAATHTMKFGEKLVDGVA